jgi:hypothetical protein
LLDQLWGLPDDKLGGYRSSVLECMARFDLEQAHRRFAELRMRGGADEKSPLARVLRLAEAHRAAATDADETLGLLAPLSATQAYPVLLELGRRFRVIDPAKAQRFAEEATVKARALPLPERASSLADVGDLVVRLNQRDAGRKLIFDAAEIAESLAADGRSGYTRGRVAVQLVRFDLNRARALIPLADANEMNRWQAAIAVRLAADDPKQALELVDAIKDERSSLSSDTRRRIAIVLAESGNLDEALKVEGGISWAWSKATALGEIAVIVAKSDPARSRALIDRTLDRFLDNGREFMSMSHMGGGTSGLAASIGYQARLAGYRDMQSVVGRILACRPNNQYDSPSNLAEMNAKTAMGLALIDPATAKWVLDRAVPAADRQVPGHLRQRREWLFAVAIADPQRGIAEIDKIIEQARNSQDGVGGTSLIELLITLTQPSEAEMVRELARWAMTAWRRDYE